MLNRLIVSLRRSPAAHGQRESIALPAEQNKRRPFPQFCRCIAWHSLTYALIIGLGFLFLSGCAIPIASTASAVGGAITTAVVANPITAASITTTVATGKSPLEHAASEATKKECNFLNLLGPKPVCQELVIPIVRDHSQEIIGLADRPTPVEIPSPSK
jgi:hypothetical protein